MPEEKSGRRGAKVREGEEIKKVWEKERDFSTLKFYKAYQEVPG